MATTVNQTVRKGEESDLVKQMLEARTQKRLQKRKKNGSNQKAKAPGTPRKKG